MVKSHSEDWLGPQWVPRFRGGREEGRAQPGPLTEAESWKHLSISRKLEKALEIFSSEFLALHYKLCVIFDFL